MRTVFRLKNSQRTHEIAMVNPSFLELGIVPPVELVSTSPGRGRRRGRRRRRWRRWWRRGRLNPAVARWLLARGVGRRWRPSGWTSQGGSWIRDRRRQRRHVHQPRHRAVQRRRRPARRLVAVATATVVVIAV